MKHVFIKFNSFLEELGPFKSRDVAMDGTKVKAVNSMGRSCTRDYLEISIDEVNELMDKYVKEMDENDAREEQEREMDRSKAQEIVKGLDEKRGEARGNSRGDESGGSDQGQRHLEMARSVLRRDWTRRGGSSRG